MAFEKFQVACSSDERISSVSETNLKIIFEQVLFSFVYFQEFFAVTVNTFSF